MLTDFMDADDPRMIEIGRRFCFDLKSREILGAGKSSVLHHLQCDGAFICRTLDDFEIARLGNPGPIWIPSVRFSPDGNFLAARLDAPDASQVVVWKVNASPPRAVPPRQARVPLASAKAQPGIQEIGNPFMRVPGHDADFSPDSGQLAVCDYEGNVTVFDLPSGKPRYRWPAATQPVTPRFSPSGDRLAIFHGKSREVEVRSVATGENTCTIKHTELLADVVRSVAWHPDGRRLATACGRLTAVWDANTGDQLKLLEGHDGRVTHVGFNAAGSLLVSTGADGVLRLWDACTHRSLVATPRGTLNLTDSVAVQFGADDRRLAVRTADRRHVLYRLAIGLRHVTLESNSGMGPLGLSYSPDGCLLATTGRTDQVRIWNVRSATQLAAIDSVGN